MTKALVEALNLLKKGREDLLQLYNQKNSDLYRYSFDYESSPSARAIASSLLDHKWFDHQIEQAFNLRDSMNLSEEGLRLFLKNIIKLSIFNTDVNSTEIQILLQTKILALQTLLNNADKMNQTFREAEFYYKRDKVLFEREMKKYSQDANMP